MSEDYEVFARCARALERIADALEAKAEIDTKDMEIAQGFTDYINLVIADGGGPGELHQHKCEVCLGRLHMEDCCSCGPENGWKNWDDERTVEGPPTVGDVVHPLEPLTQEQVERQIIAEHEREMEARDLENYDPEDDTYAMGEECPNCREGKPTEEIVSDRHPAFRCVACHYVWRDERPTADLLEDVLDAGAR